MKLSDFNYELPKELIAQMPSSLRDHSDLMVVSPNNCYVKTKFYNLIDFLKPGDLMVFNDSKVIKALLPLIKGDKKIELYFNKQLSDSSHWRAFAKPSKRLQEGDEFKFGNHKIIIAKKFSMGEVLVNLELDNISIFDFLQQYGSMPLPPYIKRSKAEASDADRYQTVYNKHIGSVAAPTAGLHFTSELLEKIKQLKIDNASITLHVGAGTFLPIRTENIDDHEMHSEYFYISQESASLINKAKAEGRRIISVGTTSLRALESAHINGQINAGEFETKIFIKPGFKFKIVDTLITNFHLPKSTLFILVSAFAGTDRMLDAYNSAINEKMRFFSYGDAMLLHNDSII